MRTFHSSWLTLLGLCLVTATACGGAPTEELPAAAISPPASSSPSVAPTPTADEPTKAEDLARTKRAVMTVAALGKPWVQPKKVNTAGGKANEACPGKPALATLAPARASTRAAFTQGAVRGASIASFTVATVSDEGAAHGAAWIKTVKNCAAYKDAAGLYVVTTLEGPSQLAGTDDVFSRAERVYFDKNHRQLAYARHYISARTGRALSTVELDFLAPKADPNAKNFAPTQKLLVLQLARTQAEFTN